MLQVQGGSLERIASALERIALCLEKFQNSDISNLNKFLINPTLYVDEQLQTSEEQEKLQIPMETEPLSDTQILRVIPSSFPQDEREEKIIRFLEEKNITINEIITEFDPELERIAIFTGERLDNLRDFCDRLKRCFNTPGQKHSLDLYFSNEKKIADINQLAGYLVKTDIFKKKDFEYHRSPVKRMDITIDGKREGEGFILGGWLEYYLRFLIDSLINSTGKDYGKLINFSRLSNVKIEFEGGRKAELDLIYEIEGNIFWFEAKTEKLDKTGARATFQKYSEYAKLLGLKSNEIFVVHIHPNNSYLDSMAEEHYRFCVTDIDNFPAKFQKEIEKLVVLA